MSKLYVCGEQVPQEEDEIITILNKLDNPTDNLILNSNFALLGELFLRKNCLPIKKYIRPTISNSRLRWYDYSTNLIILSYKVADDIANEFYEELKMKYPGIKDYYSYVYNYKILWIIYYALMHILNTKRYKRGELNAVYKYLYELSEVCNSDGVVELDGENAKLPMEIYSSSCAYDEARAIIASTKFPKPRLEIFKCAQMDEAISNYVDGKSPFELVGDNTYDKFNEVSGLPMRECLRAGLPLSYREIEKIKSKRDDLYQRCQRFK